VKAAKEVKPLDTTLGAEGVPQPTPAAEAVSAMVSARHPTLNTKPLFKLMVEKKASDLFFTSNAPIKIKIEGQIMPVNKQVLTPDTVRQTAFALMSPEQRDHFLQDWELDFASTYSCSAALPRWCCATSPPTCRASRRWACLRW